MSGRDRVLSVSAVRRYYDWLGAKLDSQGFYENPALDALVAYASFGDARGVFEFGCGTGKFAARLLGHHLPSAAAYIGCDVSPVMVGIATRRIAAYRERARVELSDGAVHFPIPDHSVDRIVCTYVLDLLSEQDMRRFFSEAHRTLAAGGKVCLASLTEGVGVASRIVSSLWARLWRLSPNMMGGCRPIRLEPFVDPCRWRIAHRQVLTPFGVPSQVLVLDMADTKATVYDAMEGR